MNELFSIIIPVYNANSFLSGCVNSIINQTYQNWHLYLVDDGSNDGSQILCDIFSNKYTNISTIHKENGGVSDARNRGMLEALGEWILFVDSDDYLETNALAVIKDLIINYETDLVLFNIKEKSIDGNVKYRSHPLKSNYLYSRNEIETVVLPYVCYSDYSFINSPCNKVYRANLIRKHNIKFPMRVRGEDWFFNINFLIFAQSLVANELPLYNYVRNSQSAMSKYCPEQFHLWEENWYIRQKLIKDYRLKVDQKKISRNFYLKVFYYLLEVKRYESNRDEKQILNYILHNKILKESLKSFPANLRELRAWIFLLFHSIGSHWSFFGFHSIY